MTMHFDSHDAIDALRERILSATASRMPVRIRGGGTKDWYGETVPGAVLDTSNHRGIVDYEPTELVITARCGTPLADIERVLAGERQMLAFEPPRFGPAATLGGAVAAGLSGPRRVAAGGVRDFVLGAQLLDGRGELLNFGGQVMKNVAGYDVSRLLAGSLGTLGVITQVSLKVLPVPLGEATIRFDVDEATALRTVNAWGGQPLPISATCWHDGVLTVRLSGAGAAVDAALRKLGGDVVADGATFWTALRDQTHAFFDTSALWRLALPPTAPTLALGGAQLIEWGGAQRWLRDFKLDAAAIRQAAAGAGGHATLFRAADRTAPVFHPLAPALARIHARLRAAFDPAGIFNPGRMG